MIRTQLRESVRLRGLADVPVGVFLSGGIDSSTIAALFAEESERPVRTFCIGFDGDYAGYKNENHYARQMADYCGAEYHERILTQEDVIAFIPDMVIQQGEPIGDASCIPTYYVSRLARDNGVIVAPVGEGSDELFWGYEGWKQSLKRAYMLQQPFGFVRQAAVAAYSYFVGRDLYPFETLRRAYKKTPIFWSGAESFHEYDKKRLLSNSYRNEMKGYTSFEALKKTWTTFREKAWEPSILNWMTYVDLRHRLPELLLARVDKMSMAASVECRVPFLDHIFVEYAMSISEKVKTRNGISKTLLKEAVRGLIPDELIDRKKQGLGVPIYDWFKDRLGTEMKKTIYEFSDNTGFFDGTYLDRIVSNHSYFAQTWHLYVLAMWHKKFYS